MSQLKVKKKKGQKKTTTAKRKMFLKNWETIFIVLLISSVACAVTVDRIEPSFGSVGTAPTKLQVHGEGFLDGYDNACVFKLAADSSQDVVESKVVAESDTLAHCLTPSQVYEAPPSDWDVAFRMEPTVQGRYLDFNGRTDFVAIIAIDLYELTHSMSLELWMRPLSLPAEGTEAGLVNKCLPGESPLTNCLYFVRLQSDGRIAFGHEYGSSVEERFVTDQPMIADGAQLGTWSHVAMTRNAATRTYRLYVDGLEAGSGQYSHTPEQGDDIAVYLGALYVVDHFHGAIDDFRMWSVVRSQAEIFARRFDRLAVDGSDASFELSTLVAYYPFNDEIDETIKKGALKTRDETGNNDFALLGGSSSTYAPSRDNGLERASLLATMATPLRFSTVPRESVRELTPPSGPLSGFTTTLAHGDNFIDSPLLQCRFGDKTTKGKFISPTMVECQSLPNVCLIDSDDGDRKRRGVFSSSSSSAVEFSISNNGQSTSSQVADGDAVVEFVYYEQATVLAVNPLEGSSNGGTRVTVIGTGFSSVDDTRAELLRCRFGGVDNVQATFISDTELHCVSPPLPDGANGAVTLEVAKNAESYTTDATVFTYRSQSEVYVEYDDPATIAFFTLAAFGALLTIVLMVLTVVYKSEPVIRASTPHFGLVILLGILFGYAIIFVLAGEPTQSICLSRIWFAGIGWALLLGALLAKNYRIDRLFRSAKQFRSIAITIMHLFMWTLAILSLEIILLICWSAIDPPNKTAIDVSFTEIDFDCESEYNDEFIGAFLALNAVFVLAGCVLAYRTRNVSSMFSESRAIAFIIYNMLVVMVLFVPLLYVASFGSAERFIIRCTCILYLLISTTLVLFGPKFYILFFCPEKNNLSDISSASRRGGTTTGTTTGGGTLLMRSAFDSSSFHNNAGSTTTSPTRGGGSGQNALISTSSGSN
jgi:7 transmembrane sweet-taste receptor of 3 GCPR/Concanavalin A-like lectin/glucanases superfamily/IPT/TIG domain